MKKGWVITLAILLLVVIGGFVWYSRLTNNAQAEGGAYNGTLKPRVELSRFDFEDINDDVITMNMYLLVDNPLPIGFKAHKVNYSFYINGQTSVH